MTTSVAEAEGTLTYPELPISHSTQIYKVSTTQRREGEEKSGWGVMCGERMGGKYGG